MRLSDSVADDPSITTPEPAPAPAPVASRRRGIGALAWLIVLVALVAGAWFGWRTWQAEMARASAASRQAEQRTAALATQIESLRGDQRTQSQRMQQAEATNRILREELLGFGQRAAAVENSVTQLADHERTGVRDLRLGEIDLVLALAEQRLRLAGELDAARRGYALAAGLMDDIDDPALIDLRQTLAQERDALTALGSDPRAVAARRVQAFAIALPALPAERSDTNVRDIHAPWWQRVLDRIVDVRPSDTGVAVSPSDRNAGLAALRLELTLAQAAVERRDRVAYRQALARADAWLQRLWPDSPSRQRQRVALRQLQSLPLSIDLPTLGSTREQLRRVRAVD